MFQWQRQNRRRGPRVLIQDRGAVFFSELKAVLYVFFYSNLHFQRMYIEHQYEVHNGKIVGKYRKENCEK
jgi:hypothetical protein